MIDIDTFQRAERAIAALRDQGETLVTVESCTGGLIAGALTAVAGSSSVFAGGFVTYSNTLKQLMVQVNAATLDRHGAVSEAVAQEMAEGALRVFPCASIALSVTGIAGPEGGSPLKPVGTVCLGMARKGQPTHTKTCLFDGTRSDIRQASVHGALDMLIRTRE